MHVAHRILGIRRQCYASKAEWGFAVLDKPARDVVSVQKAYRALMRPLHPDRAGSFAEVEAAVDVLREAKELCERALKQQNPPDRPMHLKFVQLCTDPGRRRFKVMWRAPASRQNAPVHRYVVAVHDPMYGKALSVGTLEPDYSQEFKRYLAYDDPELCSYVVSEEDLKKMPNLFKADAITVQVASGNNEGQSDWSILKVPVLGRPPRTSVGGPSVPVPSKEAHPSNMPSRVSMSGPAKRCSLPGHSSSEDIEFCRLIDNKRGRDLETWLQHQKKEAMQAWLKKRFQLTSGSKEVMISRIMNIKESVPW
jgi:hypothetical protein